MSQVRRHGQETTDHHYQPYFQPPSSAPLPLPPLSPAAARNNPTTTSAIPSSPFSLSGSLIPRDYLGPRPEHHQQQQHALRFAKNNTPVAAPRRLSPSPLQTSVRSQSPRTDDSNTSHSPLSPRSPASTSPFQNRSPVGHIAHAAFPTPPSSTGHSLSSQPETTTSTKPLGPCHQHDTRGMIADRVHASNPRKTSDTTDSNHSTTSSPVSGVSSLQSMAADRSGRAMPRTSSIDSAISSLSSTSQSHRSTFDANAVSQADIGNLIATAGSAEGVIKHLLKEKHHAASQNSQLWKLVDKQRTLILGLNKDLERALKEKEKYKKKVKEVQPPVPPNTNNDRTTQSQADEDNTSNSEGLRSQDGNAQSRTIGSPNQGEDPNNRDEVGTRSAEEMDRCRTSQTAQQSISSRRELSTASPSSVASSNSAANDSSPVENRPERVPHPMRKPPPAPLNLRPMGDTIIEQPESDDSGSEYEDVVADELPNDRGRRKTRDEDDREREATFMKEGARSVSHGQNSQLSKFAHNPANPPVLTGLPASPRPFVTQSPLPMQRSESLASILSPRTGHTGSVKERPFILSAPKSPGLPSSPRPEDRPVGSPMPRMPREIPSGLTPMTIPSGDNNLAGLALSPRASGNPNPFVSGSSAVPVNNVPPIPSIDASVKIDSPKSPNTSINGVYRAFVSDEYPNLLLPPNVLPLIEVKVSSSRLRPSRNSYTAPKPTEEEPVFTLSVFSRSENSELWRVEKIIAALPQLDEQMRQLSSFEGQLPDRSIFVGHSPAKVDARREALNSYFGALLDTPMDEKAALVVCQFLSSDAIEARDDETSLLKGSNQMKSEIMRGPDGKPRKEGYLTKRGKNFGGWKARYFVLHGPELRYFEAPGGAHMGTIKIPNAQIGKQSQATSPQGSSALEDDTDNQYRHAFLILEPKKKDSSALVRHVLCTESDEDRDAWVEALLEYVEGPVSENDKRNSPQTPKQPSSATGKAKSSSNGGKRERKGTDGPESDGPDTVQGFSFDDAVPAEPPVIGSSLDKPPPKSPLFSPSPWGGFGNSSNAASEQQLASKFISKPTNGAVIQDAGAWGNKAAAATTSNKEKKRSIWGFRARSSMDLASQLQQAGHESPTAQMQGNPYTERKDLVRPVFGLPLAEAVQYCPPQGVDVELPAVVYRCIEYLHAKGAALEEGVFRLSGSNVVVKGLKERFNTEGDIDFLATDQYYDVHAVASLFKQYLRELPTTVLTRELHLEFLRVLELDERQKKIAAFNFLVHRLPSENLTLLKTLSQYLIEIVNNSDVNKMTVRNVGIVFAPTLNIPAPVFSMFLTDYDSIFSDTPEPSATIPEPPVDYSGGADGSRTPRRQVFSALPATPYGQTSLPRMDSFPAGAYEDVRPGFEQQNYNYASMDPSMLDPNLENTHSAKAKRRESSMLFM